MVFYEIIFLMRSSESKSYMDIARDMAQQFENGESVHAGNVAYLEGFSDASHDAHEYLMDRIADIYEVTPRDLLQEPTQPKNLGRIALD
jgi:hypothetical protein